MSDSLRPHQQQHIRLPCPSPAPWVHPNPCPSSQWCHPTISSSVIPFSSCPQSFPASGSVQMSQFFTIRWPKYWSFSFSISPPMNIQDWSPSGLTGWISLQSKGLSRVLQHHSSKASILWCSAFFIVQFSHPYLTTGKTIALTRWTFVGNRTPLTASGPRFSPISCHWSAPLHSPATTLAAVHLHVPSPDSLHWLHCQVSAGRDSLQPQEYTPPARAPTAPHVPTAGTGPCCWPWSSPLCACSQHLYEHLCKDTGVMKN